MKTLLNAGLGPLNDGGRHFRGSWPVNEVMLTAALNSGLGFDEIASEFGVSVEDVVELCQEFDIHEGEA